MISQVLSYQGRGEGLLGIMSEVGERLRSRNINVALYIPCAGHVWQLLKLY